jgi:hypothetical protein
MPTGCVAACGAAPPSAPPLFLRATASSGAALREPAFGADVWPREEAAAVGLAGVGASRRGGVEGRWALQLRRLGLCRLSRPRRSSSSGFCSQSLISGAGVSGWVGSWLFGSHSCPCPGPGGFFPLPVGPYSLPRARPLPTLRIRGSPLFTVHLCPEAMLARVSLGTTGSHGPDCTLSHPERRPAGDPVDSDPQH